MEHAIIQFCLIGLGFCIGGAITSAYFIRKLKSDEQFISAIFHEMKNISPAFPMELEIAVERAERQS